jgi:DNA-binding GntR family transcriptional regulator
MEHEQTNGSSQITARGRVREDVRQLILSGELKPGTRLAQQHLARRFGVAQSVIRESLLELQASGLVRSVDNLGLFVNDLDADMLIHAYQVRELIEGLAARAACECAGRADIRELYEISDRMHEAAMEGRVEERGSLDRQFHQRTVVLSGNSLLLNLTQGYQMLNMVVQMPRDHELMLHEHRGIVEAIEQGDGEEAERRARRHVIGSRTAIAEAIAQGSFQPRWVRA